MRAGNATVVAAALIIDALLGEPPESIHPTVWMGRAISALEPPALELREANSRRAAGLLLAATLPAATFLSCCALLRATPRALRLPLEAALLSTALSMRSLGEAARDVRPALEGGLLGEARSRVGRFVGRDTSELSEAGVCRAAVESVAENTSDGVVAPMFYGLLFGAPGALAYRAINTVDSMVGYTSPRHRHLGWAGARLDDLANLAPARLTVLAVAAVSLSPARVLRTARLYGPLSSSPNAGYVEAAFAGALGLRLGGTNTYGGIERRGPFLGDGRPPGVDDIGGAVALMRRACAAIPAAALLAEGARRG
ncbi:MAG: Adenosylcobinamide-phosphate synthase [uncultured Rubrobacteraceae bacterium]|uniref:Cobalamin biosynthesis protein CobD n=1 Tax=uncultured Rubrobacteraceae bacterium TaxID=349277 RepID=A0A6J4TSX7_9ACTN|nr:MAG: Adenosylcobinamide-phosphate synthase [uncultured Rubrobacteraceae bacterium]